MALFFTRMLVFWLYFTAQGTAAIFLLTICTIVIIAMAPLFEQTDWIKYFQDPK
jgi:hypothetical protein